MENQNKKSINYWAGGYHWGNTKSGYVSHFDDFIQNEKWEMGYSRDDKKASVYFRYLKGVQIGDYIALKSYGGSHDLNIAALGIVTDNSKKENGFLSVNWIKKTIIYKGKAPSGRDSGNWQYTFLPVKRDDVINLLFKDSSGGLNRLIELYKQHFGKNSKHVKLSDSSEFLTNKKKIKLLVDVFQKSPNDENFKVFWNNKFLDSAARRSIFSKVLGKYSLKQIQEHIDKNIIPKFDFNKDYQETLKRVYLEGFPTTFKELYYGYHLNDNLLPNLNHPTNETIKHFYEFDPDLFNGNDNDKKKIDAIGSLILDDEGYKETYQSFDLPKYYIIDQFCNLIQKVKEIDVQTVSEEFKELYQLAYNFKTQPQPNPRPNPENDLGFYFKNPNIILYGPPGTGKTYHTVELAYEIIKGCEPENHNEAQELFKSERGNHIEFITFHQNYAYEDFVQGIRPKLFEQQLKFELKDGIFSKICYNALFEFYTEYLVNKEQSEEKLEFEELYNLFIDYLREQDLKTIEFDSKEKKPIHVKSINEKKNIQITHGNKLKPYLVSKNRFKKLWKHYHGDINKIKNINDDIRNVIGGCNATAYWTIFNELSKFKSDYISQDNDTEALEDFSELDFKQKKELIKSVGLNTLSNIAKNSDPLKYVLIIDEINRANISRVFGELITLIEKDKRLGGKNEIRVSLPNGEEFAIPPNLYIIGTMNTADKSIALVDIALRRRFEFRKKYPLNKIEGHDIKHVEQLIEMNKKIRELKGADFQIGHSYFMGDDFDLEYTMNSIVIPLLYEYFMNDQDSVKEVLKAGGFNFSKEDETDSGLIEFVEKLKGKEEPVETKEKEEGAS